MDGFVEDSADKFLQQHRAKFKVNVEIDDTVRVVDRFENPMAAQIFERPVVITDIYSVRSVEDRPGGKFLSEYFETDNHVGLNTIAIPLSYAGCGSPRQIFWVFFNIGGKVEHLLGGKIHLTLFGINGHGLADSLRL